MGVLTYTDEYTSSISPSRLFKALIVDSDNLIPKLLPEGFKSIEILQGDGGAGTIKKITFSEGGSIVSIKIQIDELNEETYTYKYTLIEGDALMGKFEKIAYEVQYVPSENGGTISKMVGHCYPSSDDVAVSEEEIKAGKEKALGMYKVVEAYLLQNPEAYA